MPATIRADNFPTRNISEKTFLTADHAAGVTAITPKSSQGLAVGSIIYLGTLGQEGTEKRTVSAVGSATAITLSVATSYTHDKFEDLLKPKGDQIKIYRAANVDGTVPADGSFTSIATVDIDPDQLYTEYEDATGGTGYWYKWTYYNSGSSTETALGAMDAFRGAEFGNYATIEEIRAAAGMLNAESISDTRVANKRAAAEDEINGSLYGQYELPLPRPVPPVINQLTQQLAAGFLKNDEFGQSNVEDSPGAADIRDARETLRKIKEGEITLLGVTETTQQTDDGRVTGWPDDSTEDADPTDGGSRRRHRMEDIF